MVCHEDPILTPAFSFKLSKQLKINTDGQILEIKKIKSFQELHVLNSAQIFMGSEMLLLITEAQICVYLSKICKDIALRIAEIAKIILLQKSICSAM